MLASEARIGMRVAVFLHREYTIERNRGHAFRCDCGTVVRRGTLYARHTAPGPAGFPETVYSRCLACVEPVEPVGDHRQARAVGGWQPGDDLPEDRIRRGRDGEEVQ